MSIEVRLKVFRALTNGRLNGYDMFSRSVDAQVADLMDCDADLEGEEAFMVERYVKQWRAENNPIAPRSNLEW